MCETTDTPSSTTSNADIDRRPSSERYFPRDFRPGSTDVIIGRGKKCANHEGNKNLRSIVASRLDQYSMAVSKREKSQILAAVVMQIRTGSPNGKFIKQDLETKLWFDVGNILAREKISQTFRDALVGLYRSSNDFKKKRRRAMQREENLQRSLNYARLQQATAGQNQIIQNRTILSNQGAHLSAGVTMNTSIHNPNTSIIASLSRRITPFENPFEPTPMAPLLEPTPIKDSQKCFKNPTKNVSSQEKKPSLVQSWNQRLIGQNTSLNSGMARKDDMQNIDTSGLTFLSAAGRGQQSEDIQSPGSKTKNNFTPSIVKSL